MQASEGYLTLEGGYEATAEVVDRRSRFIAQVRHVEGEAQAEEFIAEVRSRHHDARHNVPAWLLRDGRERCSDDGEPQRTAGMPCLDVLRGASLSDVCCVVTRYFGGTLLGPGGLVRAYSAAVQAAVDQARDGGHLVQMTLVTRVTCTIPYAAYGRLERLVGECGGKVRDTIFAEDVQMNCAFPTGREGAFVSAMRELANGEDLCVVGEPAFGVL
ncbi:MAG: YigZ family protein [Olsenella sp.]|nr:YigZ family protein [Olsenella sp.]